MSKPLLHGVTVSPSLCLSKIWGGGWTLDNRASAPFRNGWKCKPVSSVKNTWLISQPGVSGCATFIQFQRERDWVWNVNVYDTTPEAVEAGFKTGTPSHETSKMINNYSGFGLTVVDWILECRLLSLS